MLVRDNRTSFAKGAFGRHDRHVCLAGAIDDTAPLPAAHNWLANGFI
jgi:hypothetical protein